MKYAVEIPKLGSMILTHHWDGEIRGLNEWPPEDRPKAAIIFFSFRIMVGLGFAMLGLGAWAAFRRFRGGLYSDRWLLRASILMGPMGFVAVLAGWITTEVGRQPWTVYGLLRTSESVAANHSAATVATSLLAFVVVYFALFGAGVYYLLRLMAAAPAHGHEIEELGPIKAAGITPAAMMLDSSGQTPTGKGH